MAVARCQALGLKLARITQLGRVGELAKEKCSMSLEVYPLKEEKPPML